jgi:hypothetical protein
MLAAEPASFLAVLLAERAPFLAAELLAPMRDNARRYARRYIIWGGLVGHSAPLFVTAYQALTMLHKRHIPAR